MNGHEKVHGIEEPRIGGPLVRRRATILDVAQVAGVSRQTVSRVLNGKSEITEETRKKVMAAMQALDYRPNAAARSLHSGRTHTVGLIVPDIANPVMSDLIRGVEGQAYAEGYSVILCNAAEDPAREIALLHVLDEKRVDGIIWCGSRLAEEDLRQAARHIRAVVLVNRDPGITGVAVLATDSIELAYTATHHLIELGHRRIGLLNSSTGGIASVHKRTGYRKALQECGVEPSEDWEVEDYPDIAGGHRAALRLLRGSPGITGLVTYTDLMAIGALLACRDIKCRVPEELALVGIAGTPFAESTAPTLTTVDMPLYEMGQEAIKTVLAILKRGLPFVSKRLFEPQLQVRESSGSKIVSVARAQTPLDMRDVP